MKTGIFGGTFNPVHVGHLRAAEEVREALALDRIFWIPSARPPHKNGSGDELASPRDRLAMLELALADNPAFRPLDMELKRPGPSYTLDTLETLDRDLPGDDLYFLVGLDAFVELGTWHRPRDLFPRAHFVVLSRPGEEMAGFWSSPFVSAPPPEQPVGAGQVLRSPCSVPDGRDLFLVPVSQLSISSTDIRERIRQTRSIRYLLPAPVESYILDKGLYLSDARRTGP